YTIYSASSEHGAPVWCSIVIFPNPATHDRRRTILLPHRSSSPPMNSDDEPEILRRPVRLIPHPSTSSMAHHRSGHDREQPHHSPLPAISVQQRPTISIFSGQLNPLAPPPIQPTHHQRPRPPQQPVDGRSAPSARSSDSASPSHPSANTITHPATPRNSHRPTTHLHCPLRPAHRRPSILHRTTQQPVAHSSLPADSTIPFAPPSSSTAYPGGLPFPPKPIPAPSAFDLPPPYVQRSDRPYPTFSPCDASSYPTISP
ncbi:hypothetical protein ACLOJK_036591, partial [Asimina triloba]